MAIADMAAVDRLANASALGRGLLLASLEGLGFRV